METIYAVGHKSPDTDSIVAAITTAAFLNARDKCECYKAVAPGKLNTETEFVLNKFDYKAPEIVQDLTGKKVFLVDHNEETQQIKGDKEIIGFFDHHKIKFECSKPIEIVVRPWGSTNTIIYDLFKKEGLKIPQELKGLILCAILSDTVILKSATTTDKDKEIVLKLADELEINYKKLGMDMFKAKAQISSKTAQEIIFNDFKNFEFSNEKFGIGQIEAPDLSEVEDRIKEIKEKMNEIFEKEKYHTIILMLTDIVKIGSKLLVISKDKEKIGSIFETKFVDDVSSFLEGVMSRKKQIVPKLDENF